MRDRGKTIVLTTHFMEEAERLCDRVMIIDRGRVVALDTPADLVRSLGAEQRVTSSDEQAGEDVGPAYDSTSPCSALFSVSACPRTGQCATRRRSAAR